MHDKAGLAEESREAEVAVAHEEHDREVQRVHGSALAEGAG